MQSTDIKFIETKLGIKLPEFYISTMLNYPFDEDSWGAEFQLSNNTNYIVDINGIFESKDKNFAIGSDGGEFIYFIKLNENNGKVYIFDLENSPAHMSVEAESWKEYLTQIEKLHYEIKQDELEDFERKKNKKWWQFWI
jgi:hypothetical protein